MKPKKFNVLSAETLEILRNNLLQQARAVGPKGITLEALFQGAVSCQLNVERTHVDSSCDYLVEKGLFALVEKSHTPAIHRWKLTAAGQEHLEANGL